jgi:hypothetical protein
MARTLFERVVYDLDTQRFVMMRPALYEENATSTELADVKDETVLCPIGNSNSCFGLERATS